MKDGGLLGIVGSIIRGSTLLVDKRQSKSTRRWLYWWRQRGEFLRASLMVCDWWWWVTNLVFVVVAALLQRTMHLHPPMTLLPTKKKAKGSKKQVKVLVTTWVIIYQIQHSSSPLFPALLLQPLQKSRKSNAIEIERKKKSVPPTT